MMVCTCRMLCTLSILGCMVSKHQKHPANTTRSRALGQSRKSHATLLTAGDAWVMVETKVDLRSSAAWSQFDEAIGHFGGESAAAQAEPAVTDDDESDAGDSSCNAAQTNHELPRSVTINF